MNGVIAPSERLNPGICRVLDVLNERADPDLQEPLAMQTTVELLERLYTAYDRPKPSDIASYLTETHGWSSTQAARVGQMWETILALKHVQTGRVRPLFWGEI